MLALFLRDKGILIFFLCSKSGIHLFAKQYKGSLRIYI